MCIYMYNITIYIYDLYIYIYNMLLRYTAQQTLSMVLAPVRQ